MIRMMKYLSCILLFSALFCAEAMAQTTITAASCKEGDVQSAIGKATTDGDIVAIPAGDCTWTTPLSVNVSNSLTIQGAGAQYATSGGSGISGSDQTIIEDGVNHSGGDPALFSITTTAGKSFRLTGIAFHQSSANSTQDYKGIVRIYGSTTSLDIDHCHFDGLRGKALTVSGSVQGVVHHCLINNGNNEAIFITNGHNWTGSSESMAGNESWTDGDNWGTRKFLYVEDNKVDRGIDCFDGGRFVFRYNTLSGNGQSMTTHGTNSTYISPPPAERGCRAAAVYHNSLTSSSTFDHAMYFESGSLLFWGNKVVNFKIAVVLHYTRSDKSNYPEDPTPNGWGYCGTNFNGTGSNWDQNSDPANGYACLDQPGRGAGDLLKGYFPNVVNAKTGSISWPHQAVDPIYVWDNAYNGPGWSTDAIVGPYNSVTQDNRDFYQQFGTPGESGSFDGTRGVGQGLYSAMPSTCTAGPGGNTPGVAYWATDKNTLYVCTATGKWTPYYTPYTYPYPVNDNSASGPSAPVALSALAH